MYKRQQEKHQRTPALEFIVLLILQQLTRDARLDEQADGAGTTLAWKAQKLIRTQYPVSYTHLGDFVPAPAQIACCRKRNFPSRDNPAPLYSRRR